MKNLKIIFSTVFLVIIFTHAKAQSSSSLIGQWKTTYEVEGEKIHVNYQFKNINGKLLCRTLSLKDDKGNEKAYNAIVMSDIQLKNGNGKAKYILKYEGETYEVIATLKLIKLNIRGRLQISQDVLEKKAK